jgi:class 3 adenylate cyclase
MAHTWKYDHAAAQIGRRLEDVKTVDVVDYARDMSLDNIRTNQAYRVDAVHLYVDILNVNEMLQITQDEGVSCHRQTLHLLDHHYRAVSRILARADARRVDIHNQRLHAIIAKPYNTQSDAEKSRVARAVALGKLLIDVLAQAADDHSRIPVAKVRVGIDSGVSLAVNNGRNGYREPLFLGDPANHAAKMAGGGNARGIFLTNTARQLLGLQEVPAPQATALTADEIRHCENHANLDVSAGAIVDEWREDLRKHPVGDFEFYRHTPPLKTMDIASLTPANSRRQEAVSVHADIDGFTRYVHRHLAERPADVVKALHVLRAELERVVTEDFSGRRIRFIGDCVHALICEGTAHTTDAQASISTAALCAGGLRSSFELALKMLRDAGIDTTGLGLAIGLEYGPVTVTRLGGHGDRIRCSVSRATLSSEIEQTRCGGSETAIGPCAFEEAGAAVRKLFGKSRVVSLLDFNEAAEALASQGDTKAAETKQAALSTALPAVARAAERVVRPHALA